MDFMKADASSGSANSPGENEVKYWLAQIQQAESDRKDYNKIAKKAVDIYEARERSENSFNILYSNTEILGPAVYSQLPIPDARRRFDDDDLLGMAASEAINRMLKYQLDSPDQEYRGMHALFQEQVLGALVAGEGSIRLKYDPELAPMAVPGQPPADTADTAPEVEEEIVKKGAEAEAGDIDPSNEVEPEKDPNMQVAYETLCGEYMGYQDVRYGPGRTWERLPWIAYPHDMTKSDVKRAFGKAVAEEMKYSSEMRDKGEDKKDPANVPQVQTAVIYEVWHKTNKTVLFVSEGYPKKPLRRTKDPLKLSGFFPQAEPLTFLRESRKFIPIVLYQLYENQAKELNKVSLRINKLISALKVRGFYNGTIKEIADLMARDDGDYLPLENPNLMDGTVKLDGQFWTMPLDDAIKALRELYGDREEVKRVIYELTGISDIIRGSSAASETLGAQQIKQQWGTMRISRMQSAVAGNIRGTCRIMAELAVEHFSDDTWAAMTQLPYLTDAQMAEMQQQIAAGQAAMQQAPPQPPAAPPQPGQPPAPQPPNPQQQQLDALQAKAGGIQWKQVLGLLRDDLQRQYHIDIETNSTLATESAEDRQNITDVTAAIGQLMQGFAPMVDKGMPLGSLKAMMIGVSRKFRLGKQFEEQISKIPDQAPPQAPPPQPPPDPAAQAESQAKIAVAQAKLKEVELKSQAFQEKIAGEKELAQLDLEVKREELQIKKEELQLKREEMKMKMQMGQQQLHQRHQEGQQKLALGQQEADQAAQQGQMDMQVADHTAQTTMAANEAKVAAAAQPQGDPNALV